ncbi:hypothetical protein ARMSODRAFT_954982 [Armillaria solidipes]|uniref:Uncharacterized protein n=1 Tax=Armillaria solidipes TaxID=1076256 RepID=A0A2H3C518_9AGAR|nr:hypothetical protein ARMSODRAFT_954982 [Armillaria solidipes]
MANLLRTAKSSSNWTISELDAYHIEIVSVDPLDFFGVQALPPPQVDPEILDHVEATDMIQDKNAELVGLLDLESAAVDFAVELFKMLGYVKRDRLARTRVDLPLLICGEYRHARTDVCLVDCSQNDILLLVQEDNEAQLVAEAVAAFAQNNQSRRDVGLPLLDEKVCETIASSSSIQLLPSVDYGWNRDVRYDAHFLQGPCLPKPPISYPQWHLSSRAHAGYLLRCPCPTSW